MDLELQQFKAEFFKGLSHPLHIRIFEVLSKEELSVIVFKSYSKRSNIHSFKSTIRK